MVLHCPRRLMVLELTGRHRRHGHGRPLGSITVARPGLEMGAVSEGAHHIVNHHEDTKIGTIRASFIGHSSGEWGGMTDERQRAITRLPNLHIPCYSCILFLISCVN